MPLSPAEFTSLEQENLCKCQSAVILKYILQGMVLYLITMIIMHYVLHKCYTLINLLFAILYRILQMSKASHVKGLIPM